MAVTSNQPSAPGLREIRKILVGIGLTTESVGAAAFARLLARRLGAELHAVHVIQPLSAEAERAIPGLAGKHLQQAEAELKRFASAHGLEGGPRLHVCKGVPEREILELRATLHADLLIVGRYGKGGLKHDQIGSIADRLVRKSPVGVLVAEPTFGMQGEGRIERIGVATDLSEHSMLAVRRGVDLAQRLGASEIVLLHAYELPVGYHMVYAADVAQAAMEQAVTERALDLARQVAEEFPGAPKVRTRVACGPAAMVVPDLSRDEKLDLLVISTHGRSGAATMLLGKTSEKIIRRGSCSTWAVRSPELYQGFADAMKHLMD